MNADEVMRRAKQLGADEIARYKVAESTDAYRMIVMFSRAAVPIEVYRGLSNTLLVIALDIGAFLFAADGHFVSVKGTTEVEIPNDYVNAIEVSIGFRDPIELAEPPKRTPTVAVYVRCSRAEKDALEKAAASVVAHVPGMKLAVHTYMLQAALEKAKAAGFTVPGAGDEKKTKGAGR